MSFRRIALGFAVSTLLAPALALVTAEAAHADSTFCPQATSTRLLTANNGQHKLWLYQPSGQEVHVCYATYYVSGELIFRTGLTGSLVPTVTPVTNDTSCSDLFTLQDPVQFITEGELTDTTDPYSYCFGVGNNAAVRITVDLPNGTPQPAAELWLDRNAYVTQLYCSSVMPSDPDCQTYDPNGVRVL